MYTVCSALTYNANKWCIDPLIAFSLAVSCNKNHDPFQLGYIVHVRIILDIVHIQATPFLGESFPFLTSIIKLILTV